MISYMAAFLAVLTNAAANVLNRKATSEQAPELRFRLALFLDLLRRRTWLYAFALMLTSFVLSATALSTGQISAVQPIIVLDLPMTLIAGTMILGGKLGRRDWGAVTAMTAGVIGLLVALDPQPGPKTGGDSAAWIFGSVVNGSAVLALLVAAYSLSRQPGHQAAQAALLGLGAGIAYGLAAAYLKGLTGMLSTGGLVEVIRSWHLYAAIVTGIVATFLMQNSYHAGQLAAAQPGITLADPLVGMIWGIMVFQERIRGDAFFGPALIPLLLLGIGVFMLSRSPSLRDQEASAAT